MSDQTQVEQHRFGCSASVDATEAPDYVYPTDPINSMDLDGRETLPGGEWLCEDGGPGGWSAYGGKTLWSDLQFERVGYKPNFRPAHHGGFGLSSASFWLGAAGVWAYAACGVTGGGGCVVGQALLTASTAVAVVDTATTCASKGVGKRCAASVAGTMVGLVPGGSFARTAGFEAVKLVGGVAASRAIQCGVDAGANRSGGRGCRG